MEGRQAVVLAVHPAFLHTSLSTEQGCAAERTQAHREVEGRCVAVVPKCEKLSTIFEVYQPTLQSCRGFSKINDTTQLMDVDKMQKSMFKFALGVTCI